jgi:DNA-directed RNA polymerase specialized sigma24 family protein
VSEAAGGGEPAGLFPPTRWTLVLSARERPELRRAALEALVAPRWKAFYVLARKQGLAAAEAEDAVQSFVLRIVEGDLLDRLDPGKGRLRAYLKTALRHHLANLHEHAVAEKRGGGRPIADLQAVEELVASSAPSPDVLFDRAWALSMFEETMETLEQEYADGTRRGPFAVLRDLFRLGETEAYPTLAARHGMSVPQLKAFVHRARLRFRQLLVARVADTVVAGDDVDAEVSALFSDLTP